MYILVMKNGFEGMDQHWFGQDWDLNFENK